MKAYLRCMLLGSGVVALQAVPTTLYNAMRDAEGYPAEAMIAIGAVTAGFLVLAPLVGWMLDRLLSHKGQPRTT